MFKKRSTTKSPIIYFFPNKEIPDFMEERLKGGSRRKGVGPGDMHGLFCTPFDDPTLEYDREFYGPLRKVGGVFIAVAKEVTPESFKRDVVTAGYSVDLGDGNKWVIPVAYLDSPNLSLPAYDSLDDNRDWVKVVDEERFDCITSLAAYLWDRSMCEDGSVEMDENQVRNICCEAIKVNYDLSHIEIAALKLLNTEAYQAITGALIDLQGIKEIEEFMEGKKKLSEDQHTNSGERDV